MCKLTCCPTITWKSFTAIITVVDIAMFIVTLVFGWQTAGEFLSPSIDILIKFGGRTVADIIYKYQVWRFLTPVFLHANFLHIFFNCFSQLIFGSQVEVMMGTKRFIAFYFLCALGGNLFGGLFDGLMGVSVGASTAIVGLLGVFIAFVIVNWNRLDTNMRCFMMCMVFFIIMINLVFSSGGSEKLTAIDNYGHLGGLLTGTFAGMFFIVPQGAATKYEKRVKIIGYCLTAFFFILCSVLYYVVHKK